MKQRVRGLMIDVDGTLYFKGRALPGAVELLDYLRGVGLGFRLVTNIDSQAPEEIAEELAAAGIEVPGAHIMNPLRALACFLEEGGSDGRERTCRFLMSARAAAPFASFCPGPRRESPPDYVVVGDCRDGVDYSALNAALRDLLAGARLVATQPGRHYLRADGAYLDTGSIARALEYASGMKALFLGKPSGEFAALALDSLGLEAGSVLVVGDDVATDVPTARAIGARSVLVRTGRYDADTVASAQHGPDFTVDDLHELRRLLGEMNSHDSDGRVRGVTT